MTKIEFLTELEKQLGGLPSEDIQKSLDYYAEMIDDCVEDGLCEQEAVAVIGKPIDIANEILMDIPLSKLVKQKIKPNRSLTTWEIVLIVLGAPLWFSLIVAAAAITFSVYIVLWAVIISLYAVAISVAACVIACMACVAIYMIMGRVAESAFVLGAGLVCAGLAIIMFLAFNQVTKGLFWISKKIWLLIKSCFIKGDAK